MARKQLLLDGPGRGRNGPALLKGVTCGIAHVIGQALLPPHRVRVFDNRANFYARQGKGLGLVQESAVLRDHFIEGGPIKSNHVAVGPHGASADTFNRDALRQVRDLDIRVGSTLFRKNLDAQPLRLNTFLVIRVNLPLEDHGRGAGICRVVLERQIIFGNLLPGIGYLCRQFRNNRKQTGNKENTLCHAPETSHGSPLRRRATATTR